jgi:hypothetical protein
MPKSESTALSTPSSAYLALNGNVNIGAIIAENAGKAGITPGDLERVRVPAGGATSWTISTLQGETEAKTVDGIVVEFRDVRAYWSKPFDEGGGAPPDCSSADGETGVGTPGGACATCPLASWGSAGKGRKGQACRSMRLIATLMPGELLPRVIVVPPSSLGTIRKFFNRLSSQALRYCDVVTSFALERTKNDAGISYSRILPTMAGEVDDATRPKVAAYRKAISPAFHAVTVEQADTAGEHE